MFLAITHALDTPLIPENFFTTEKKVLEPLKDSPSIIKATFAYHTRNRLRAYQWHHSHFVRKSASDYLPLHLRSKIGEFLILPQLQLNVCTITALYIFSIFSEKRNNIEHEAGRGVTFSGFKNIINREIEEKGTAFLCELVCHQAEGYGSIHEFVIEKTVQGHYYLYQSYVNEYNIHQGLTSSTVGPWVQDDLLAHLETLVSSKEWTQEKRAAYKILFNVELTESLPALDFHFKYVEYDPNNLPQPPQEPSLNEKISWIWEQTLNLF